MKFISIVLAFLLLFQITPLSVILAEDQEKVIVISDMVGEEIDNEERKEYSLFLNIADFERATFYTRRESVLIEIEAKHKTLISHIGDTRVVYILKDYFEIYEEISADREAFEEKWSIIGYDDQGIPITQNEALRYCSKASWWTYGCCIFGGLGGLGIGVAVIFNPKWQKETDLHPMLVGVPIAVGAISGYAIGNKIDKSGTNREDIIKKIRRLRTPR